MNIVLNDQELDLIYNALAQRPWGEVNNLMVSITQQVAADKAPKADSNG